mmetsp:Transcript_11619/g.30702  ORF Transcript_11619/g.30702 Transcript_11619/m.30702 type:complete len:90 (+) Transcript_11619:404-673(+)
MFVSKFWEFLGVVDDNNLFHLLFFNIFDLSRQNRQSLSHLHHLPVSSLPHCPSPTSCTLRAIPILRASPGLPFIRRHMLDSSLTQCREP